MPKVHACRLFLLAACVGLPVGLATAQIVAPTDPSSDMPMSMDDSPLVLEPHIGCGKACVYHAAYTNGLTPDLLVPGQRPRVSPRGPGNVDPMDVLHNNIAIEVLSVTPPASGSGSGSASITGSNTMTIRSNVSNLTSFKFNLRSQYTVTSCTVTDSVGSYSVTPTTPPANNSSYQRTITFTRPIAQGETFTITVAYSGNTANVGLGSFFAGRQQGANTTTTVPLVVCSLSQPYYAGTWWPCKDGDVRFAGDNIDRATMDMAITVTANPGTTDLQQGVSNGVLVGVDTLSGNRKRYRWSTSYSLPTYLVCMAASTYNQFTVNYNYPGGTMPLEFYIYPSSDNATNRAAWTNVVNMLEAFRPVYGLYPFINEKYGIYQFEFSGGMEHQTNTGQGRAGAFNESITAHELGHQWWGDHVTCRTWSDIWLNEGMATYSEAIWLERRPGSAGLSALQGGMVARKPGNPAGTVWITPYDPMIHDPNTPATYADTTGNVSRVFSGDLTYRKAAWVFHMLRKIMGDTAFFNLLQTYRATYGQSAASTTDFIALASSVHGSDLSWYFTPWVYQGGAPTYQYGWANATIDGQNYLRLNVSQTQSGTYPVFDMPMDVQVTTTAGTQTVNVRTNALVEDLLIPINAPATAVVLDPSDWILNYGKSQVAYATGSPKVVSASVAPGASLTPGSGPSTLAIVFSDDVNVSASNIGVTRGSTNEPFTFAYTPGTATATLTFAGPLSAGTYNVAISDAITAASNGQALDGELANNTPTALPSGDGQPGGPSLFTFTVQAPACAADFNSSGSVSTQDIFDFLNAWFSGSPSADFNGTDGLTVQDIFDFLNSWFAGC